MPIPHNASTLFTGTLVLAADHAGYALKEAIKAHLATTYPSITVIDSGCYNTDSVEYPSIIANGVQTMAKNDTTAGIFVCGSGAGVCMGANRYPQLRAILAHDTRTAYWSRRHNDANVLCLGGRVVAEAHGLEITDIWLTTAFDGGRHDERVANLSQLGQDAPAADACCV